MKSGNKKSVSNSSAPGRRVNARYVSKLRAIYKGAQKRVNNLISKIAEVNTDISNGFTVVVNKGVKMHVKLSLPELQHLRDRRNLMQLDLDKAKEDLETSKAKYLAVVSSNSSCSRQSLQTTRKARIEKKKEKVLSAVKVTLNEASQNGKREQVLSLKKLADANIASDLRQELKAITGFYIPVGLDLTQIQNGLKAWESSDSTKLIFG